MTKQHPILFNAAMVRAILNGSKTQTRRVIKNVRNDNCISIKKPTKTLNGRCTHVIDAPEYPRLLPIPVSVGDLLWVRETWRPVSGYPKWDCCVKYPADNAKIHYPDDIFGDNWHWPEAAKNGNVPSIHMPKWASRITLKVTDVRVERLQGISKSDAIAEGVFDLMPRTNFQNLWDSIYAKTSPWESNPWVAAYTFERVDP